MRKIFLFILGFISVLSSVQCVADCNIYLSVSPSEQIENVPIESNSILTERLIQVLTNNDFVVEDSKISPFTISGKFSHIIESTLPGPPIQTALQTNLTIYLGDTRNATIYGSVHLILNGVGTSLQRAFINAMKGVNSSNKFIQEFLKSSSRKIIDYYDARYPQILASARRSCAIKKYDEALWILSMVPECSVGYQQTCELMNEVFQDYIDYEGERLLSEAYAVWSTSQDLVAAEAAFEKLLRIDADSKAYGAANSLAEKINLSVADDRKFELRQKYSDHYDLEKRRIESARQIGVAYGKGQKQISINNYWLK